MAAAPDFALNWFKKVQATAPSIKDVRAYRACRAACAPDAVRRGKRPCLIKRNPIAPTRHPVKKLNRFKDFGVSPT
ncbi:hypothetical protein CATMQ487_46350 [Sphaerotilus microaerophilus]|uniref:Uncharacterized protein n=1 Tax=Sphaerotilus microaerophilus TaxID=2914710 RepID=A0ABN6PWP0_9BURK|nr:hypothetical protein CATMQ487_46350 [Sphaerotilus sp. FB-5]